MPRLLLISIFMLFFLSGGAHAERMVFLGDSLTAGYGLDPEQAYPHLVEEALRKQGRDVTVVNAGVSGDTTAGGLRRLDWVLRQEIDTLFIALGANDALRGQPVDATLDNLRGMIRKAKEKDPSMRIVLLGMLAPPNMGAAYRERFAGIYPRLAREEQVELIPFMLENVAGDPLLNLADGIHPNAKGHRLIARTVLQFLDQSG